MRNKYGFSLPPSSILEGVANPAFAVLPSQNLTCVLMNIVYTFFVK